MCEQACLDNPGFYFIPPPPLRRQSRRREPSRIRKIYLSTASLVIVPSNLVQQWRSEIKKHTIGLKVLVMDDMKLRLPNVKDLIDFDIILFSKQRFEREAKSGSDKYGRHASTSSRECRCTYIGATRERDCECFSTDDVYWSPLNEIHFKRIIVDEGHTFGNASKSKKTEAMITVDALQISARWIISGTPAQGLYGIEESAGLTNVDFPLRAAQRSPVRQSLEHQRLTNRQEQIDLEKLGNMAISYLKMKPWSNRVGDPDYASWSQCIMSARGSRRFDCLKATLEGMMVRHQFKDTRMQDILPPLHQKTVKLRGSIVDKISLNVFTMMIVSNAITSERKDIDYLFHPKQRAALQSLLSNLRQASFFWSGFSAADLTTTLENSQRFLDRGEVPISDSDRVLLQEGIENSRIILGNPLFHLANEYHEVPIYCHLRCPDEILSSWALDGLPSTPTLMGLTMAGELKKSVQQKMVPIQDLANDGETCMRNARQQQALQNDSGDGIDEAQAPEAQRAATTTGLAGNVQVGNDKISRRSVHSMASRVRQQTRLGALGAKNKNISTSSMITDHYDQEFLASKIVATASTKLSYLLDQIMLFYLDEKIIVFYEADNVAYYIAQALELLHVRYLIYAKSLTAERRSRYLVTFNKTETFRVLLMNVSQAAFGLDISSASRIFFINPVFSPQVEVQAVKRAHRIGQNRPVHVETLVLEGSIEEAIIERRSSLSSEQHRQCKTLLDDEVMFEWIRNARFLPLPMEDTPSTESMVALDTPQQLFNLEKAADDAHPDADLITSDLSPTSVKTKSVRSTSKAAQSHGISQTMEVSPASSPSKTQEKEDSIRNLSSAHASTLDNAAFSVRANGLGSHSPPEATSPGNMSEKISILGMLKRPWDGSQGGELNGDHDSPSKRIKLAVATNL